MSLLTLDISPPPRFKPPLRLRPGSGYPRLSNKAINGRPFPVRGLVYSFILHEIGIFAMIFIPPILGPRHPIWPEKQWEATMMPKDVLYLPQLGGGSQGGSPRKAPHHASPGRKSPAPVASAPGVRFAGNQEIVSNPPNPTNHIQTILQPDLPKPPTLKGFVPLPNMVLLAKAPPPPPPPPNPVVTPKPVTQATEPPAPRPVVPPKPAPKVVETRPQASVPKVVVARHVPKLSLAGPQPVEAPHLTLPETTLATSSVPLFSAPTPPPPAPPAPPKQAAETKPVPPLMTAETPPQPSVKAPETKPTPAPPQALPVGESLSARNLLVLSPAPVLNNAHPSVPKGEARGQFAISRHPGSDHSLPGAGAGTSTAKALGVGTSAGPAVGSAAKSGGEGSGAGGGGNGRGKGAASGEARPGGRGGGGRGGGSEAGGGQGEGTGAGIGLGAGQGTATGHGTGSGAGAGPGASPFAGMTIQGAEEPAGAVAISGGSNPPAENQSGGSYDLTIVTTGNSGGGVGDFGVFEDEAVFTVYLNPAETADDPLPPWPLQYALLNSTRSPLQDLVPPVAVKKMIPVWPSELSLRYQGQQIVAYAVIDAGGKMQHLKILETPNALLSEVLIRALEQWVFRPASLNGRPVAVKVVLGVPVTRSQ